MDQQPGYSAPYCIIFLRAFSEKGLQSPAEGSFPTFSKLIAIIARAFIQVPTTVSGRKGQRQRHTTYIYISWCEAREDYIRIALFLLKLKQNQRLIQEDHIQAFIHITLSKLQ